MAKVFGTIVCVGGAISMGFLKGPKLLILELSTLSSILNPTDDRYYWIIGFLFLAGCTCFWSLWLILQVLLHSTLLLLIQRDGCLYNQSSNSWDTISTGANMREISWSLVTIGLDVLLRNWPICNPRNLLSTGLWSLEDYFHLRTSLMFICCAPSPPYAYVYLYSSFPS